MKAKTTIAIAALAAAMYAIPNAALAAPFAGTSTGTFSGYNNTSGDGGSFQTLNSGGGTANQINWGYGTIDCGWRCSQSYNGSLLTVTNAYAFAGATPAQDVKLAELTWFNEASPSSLTPDVFTINLTLKIDFTNPNAAVQQEVFNLEIKNTKNPPGDITNGLTLADLTSLTASLNGALSGFGFSVSDMKYLVTGTDTNLTGSQWFNAEGKTAKLYITADIAARTVPEPGTLALLAASLAGIGWSRRRSQ